MSRRDAALGLLVGASLLAVLPIGVHLTGGKHDLEVRTRGAYELRSDTNARTPRAEVVAGSDRATIAHSLPSGTPGLDLVSYRATYGDAWHREVTEPVLVGSLVPKDGAVCGYTLQVSQSLFDTKGAGAALEELVISQVAPQFPQSFEVPGGIHVHFPALDEKKSTFEVTLGEGHGTVRLLLAFVDGTKLGVRFGASVVSDDGSPAVRRIDKPQVEFRGPVRDDIVRQASAKGGEIGTGVGLLGCFFGPIGCAIGAGGGALVGSELGEGAANLAIPLAVSYEATRNIDAQLGNLGLARFKEPWKISKDRPNDTVRLRLERDPVIESTALTLPLCASIHVAEPMIDPTITGPVRLHAQEARATKVRADHPTLDLAMNGDALNQVVWYLWQSGKLQELGRSDLALAGLKKSVQAAAFDFTGLDPQLPPTLDPASSGKDALSFTLANVQVGHTVDRSVMSHGKVALAVSGDDGTVSMTGLVRDLHVDCAKMETGEVDRTACFGDLLPVAREQAAKRPVTQSWDGGALLTRLPTLAFGGVTLRLSGLTASTQGSTSTIDLRVLGRLETSGSAG